MSLQKGFPLRRCCCCCCSFVLSAIPTKHHFLLSCFFSLSARVQQFVTDGEGGWAIPVAGFLNLEMRRGECGGGGKSVTSYWGHSRQGSSGRARCKDSQQQPISDEVCASGGLLAKIKFTRCTHATIWKKETRLSKDDLQSLV